MSEIIQKKFIISPPNIVQGCFAIKDSQEMVGVDPGNKEYADQLRVLEAKYREAILVAGGMDAVDQWLTDNDPKHTLLKDIKKIDWSFLVEE